MINDARDALRERLVETESELTPKQRMALRVLRERHHV
jgi:hypothetical protein